MCLVGRQTLLSPTKHIIGHIGDDFNRSCDQTNSVKALKVKKLHGE